MHAEALMLSPSSAETGPRVETFLRIAVFEPLRFPFQTDVPRNVYPQHKTSPHQRYSTIVRSFLLLQQTIIILS